MKIFVFSDSHGYVLQMLDVIKKHKSECDYIIHLGDHCTDTRYIDTVSGITPMVAVIGNNDHYMARNEYPEERIIELKGKRLFLTHGHRQGVKSGYDVLASLAINKQCDIALFGHTHTAFCGMVLGVHLMNPGSIGYPSIRGYTYGVITIENDILDFEIREV